MKSSTCFCCLVSAIETPCHHCGRTKNENQAKLWHRLLMTRAASQRMMKMGAALWGSQSWLQPAFSRPCAGHEGSLMAQEPPERRLRARLPAPRLFSRKALPCASGRSPEECRPSCARMHKAEPYATCIATLGE